jgi:sirohydrochlorin cobaltochelatase
MGNTFGAKGFATGSAGTVMMGTNDRDERRLIEDRLRILLPPEYQDSYEQVEPTPMRSAGLRYGEDGKVAWDEMWSTFCDLALAGGPPHKGTLLEPASQAEIDAQPERYAEVVAEICRGIAMATDLPAVPSPFSGWISVGCDGEAMAGWLLRAIVMENVAARCDGDLLYVPAGSDYRLEKEIKNVVTVTAKTSHYWLGHVPRLQQRAIANLFGEMAKEWPLVEPRYPSEGLTDRVQSMSAHVAGVIEQRIGLRQSNHRYANWLGLECPSVRAAIWMMRGLVVRNVLSRREGTVLFVPINPEHDPNGERVVRSLTEIHRAAVSSQVV